MASGKLSPRQKMINMMYLVLTAMLALNVSAEILKAFAMINKSLEDTNLTIDQKNAALYTAFEEKMKDEPGKTKAAYDKAMTVKRESKELLDFVKKVKEKLIDEGGNKNGKLDEPDFKIEGGVRRILDDGNIDISSTLLVNPDGKSKLGLEMKDKFSDFRKKLIALIPQVDRDKVKIHLDDPIDPSPSKGSGVKKNWLQSNFGEMPLSGVVTLFTKYESDIRNTESEIVTYLLGSIDAASFKFDQVEAKVIAKSSYVLTGQDFEADVMLVAYDSRQNLDIRLDGGAVIPVENGLGKYKARATSEGEKKLNGYILVKNPGTGEETKYPFTTSYTVARPAAVVSPDKMNVFYIGVDNPVSISAPGVKPADLTPSITKGTLTGSGGKYVVRVMEPGKVNVDVRSKGEAGKGASMLGSSEFRVKYVPDPIATVGSLPAGSVASTKFKAQGGMIALLKDFDFDLRFEIRSFRLIYLAPRKDAQVVSVSGPVFTQAAQNIIRNAKPGDRFIFDEVKAVGPDKVTRTLPAVTYGLN
ncbi:MAG: gliding motility protein GldM [Bacteroidota bacterium]